ADATTGDPSEQLETSSQVPHSLTDMTTRLKESVLLLLMVQNQVYCLCTGRCGYVCPRCPDSWFMKKIDRQGCPQNCCPKNTHLTCSKTTPGRSFRLYNSYGRALNPLYNNGCCGFECPTCFEGWSLHYINRGGCQHECCSRVTSVSCSKTFIGRSFAQYDVFDAIGDAFLQSTDFNIEIND
ncbi:unnamed protein product, partial [Meganyctiphanes norvegica]